MLRANKGLPRLQCTSGGRVRLRLQSGCIACACEQLGEGDTAKVGPEKRRVVPG